MPPLKSEESSRKLSTLNLCDFLDSTDRNYFVKLWAKLSAKKTPVVRRGCGGRGVAAAKCQTKRGFGILRLSFAKTLLWLVWAEDKFYPLSTPVETDMGSTKNIQRSFCESLSLALSQNLHTQLFFLARIEKDFDNTNMVKYAFQEKTGFPVWVKCWVFLGCAFKASPLRGPVLELRSTQGARITLSQFSSWPPGKIGLCGRTECRVGSACRLGCTQFPFVIVL